jgi:hypothetical protein
MSLAIGLVSFWYRLYRDAPSTASTTWTSRFRAPSAWSGATGEGDKMAQGHG